MVREKQRVVHALSSIFLAATLLISSFIIPKVAVSAVDQTVTVKAEEMLTVKVTTPTTWASGNFGCNSSGSCSNTSLFLRNTVSLAITTNNETGFTATMTATTTNTSLTNTDPSKSSYTIPTLTSNIARSSFPDNYWGYSINDDSNSGTYRPVAALGATSPSYIANSAYNSGTTTKNVYFGAKANLNKASGTYANSVVFNVVSGVNAGDGSTNTSGVTPTNPVTPSIDTNTSDTTPTYNSTLDRTVYTKTSTTSGTSSTGTVVTPGNSTSATYSNPAGVSSSTLAKIDEGTPLATGLAVTAGVAATAGIIFFIIAKRRKDDEEEEDYYDE